MKKEKIIWYKINENGELILTRDVFNYMMKEIHELKITNEKMIKLEKFLDECNEKYKYCCKDLAWINNYEKDKYPVAYYEYKTLIDFIYDIKEVIK